MNLIFVYNANSGKVNALFDVAHKVFKPETYQCSLCMLTHGTLTENKLMREFKSSGDINIEFLHKDEFKAKYSKAIVYPAILTNDAELEVVLDHNAISKIEHVSDLIAQLARITTLANQ